MSSYTHTMPGGFIEEDSEASQGITKASRPEEKGPLKTLDSVIDYAQTWTGKAIRRLERWRERVASEDWFTQNAGGIVDQYEKLSKHLASMQTHCTNFKRRSRSATEQLLLGHSMQLGWKDLEADIAELTVSAQTYDTLACRYSDEPFTDLRRMAFIQNSTDHIISNLAANGESFFGACSKRHLLGSMIDCMLRLTWVADEIGMWKEGIIEKTEAALLYCKQVSTFLHLQQQASR